MKHIHFLSILLLCCMFACNPIDSEPEVDPNPSEEQDPEPSKDTVAVESSLPTIGEFSYLVVLVETSDVHFSIEQPQKAFWDMLNKQGYSDYGGTGSVRDYFVDQSMKQYIPNFDVVGPVVVDMAMSNFTIGRGLTKLGAARLFAMACDKIDSEVNFAKYDSDKNGVIDNVFFYFAGYNSADGPDDAIWPHAGVVEYKQWTFDGVKFTDYACTSELKGSEGINMARIGNFCHEFAHVLGLPDLYDTETGKADGVGDFSLMHSGCYNNSGNTPPSLNCEERMLLGWMKEIPELPSKGSSISFGPISSNVAYKSETTNSGEYFCYEYRDGQGWDAYVPKGLVIYHVDKSNNDVNGRTAAFRWKHLYDLNGYPSHECFDLVKASDSCTVFGTGINQFTPVSWSGETQNYSITDIAIDSTVIGMKVL